MKHWIHLPVEYTRQDVMNSVLDINHSVAGFMVRIFWREMYNGMEYQLGELLKLLNYAAEQGKQIVLMPIDKTFKNPNPYLASNPVPAHLANLAEPNRAGGYTALRWHYEIRTAWNDLLRHLSWLYGHPGFGGVMLQETAPSLDDLPDYHAQVYLDTYKEFLSKYKKLYFQLNFVPGGNRLAEQMCNQTVMNGNTMGGPDFLVEDEALVKTTFPLWEKARAAGVPLFAGVSVPCYSQPYNGKPLGLVDMIKLAEQRGISELFWQYKPFGEPSIFDALKVM